MATVEYERFAEIYRIWSATATSARSNLEFYLDAYLAAEGPVVELGIGDGRIAVEAAIRGRHIVGVDLSPAMLRLCRERGEEAGVLSRLTLFEADFRTFELPEPAALIALPYHSLGHLLSAEDKLAALRHIHAQLRPGGRFVFDDFLMSPERLDRMRRVELRAEYTSTDGTDRLLWVTSLVDAATQRMRVVTWEDELDTEGMLLHRRYRKLSLSWLEPEQTRGLLADAGFAIDACYGDFRCTPFSASSAQEQIWIARKDTNS